MAKIDGFLKTAVGMDASDIHFAVSVPPMVRQYGQLRRSKYADLTAAQITQIVEESTWVLNSLTDGRFHPKECWLAEISLTGCRFRIPRGPLLIVESV